MGGVDCLNIKNTVHLVSLDILVFNILIFFQTKGTDAITCMFGEVFLYLHAVTWCYW